LSSITDFSVALNLQFLLRGNLIMAKCMGREIIISCLMVLIGFEPALLYAAAATNCPPAQTNTEKILQMLAEERVPASSTVAPATSSAATSDAPAAKSEAAVAPVVASAPTQSEPASTENLSIANAIFLGGRGAKSAPAEAVKAYRELGQKYGRRPYFIMELLSHYERWNNSKFDSAKSISEVPTVQADADPSLAKFLGLTDADSKKNLRDVLIEKFLSHNAGDEKLKAMDEQIGKFFDYTLPLIFEKSELSGVYERLNRLPADPNLFLTWDELVDLNRLGVLNEALAISPEAFRKELRKTLRTDDILQVSFAKINSAMSAIATVGQVQKENPIPAAASAPAPAAAPKVVAPVPAPAAQNQPALKHTDTQLSTGNSAPASAAPAAAPSSSAPQSAQSVAAAPAQDSNFYAELRTKAMAGDWKAIASAMFQVRRGEKNSDADAVKLANDLRKKYGSKNFFYVSEILSHYEHWNNPKYQAAKAIDEVAIASAGVDSELAKDLKFSEGDSKKSMREVLIEAFLKDAKKAATLKDVDDQFGAFYDFAIPIVFEKNEQQKIFDRLNRLPQEDKGEGFISWKEMKDINRLTVVQMMGVKPEGADKAVEDFRKQMKDSNKTTDLTQLSFSKLAATLQTLVGPKEKEITDKVAQAQQSQEKGAIMAMLSSPDLQSDLYMGGKIRDQVEAMGIQSKVLPATASTFEPLEYRKQLKVSELMQAADKLDDRGHEAYRLIDKSKEPASLEIRLPSLDRRTENLLNTTLVPHARDAVNEARQREEAQARHALIDSFTQFQKYATREEKLKHVIASQISSNGKDSSALAKTDEFLMFYPLDDLTRLHFIRQTITEYPLYDLEGGKRIATKDLESLAVRITTVQDRLSKIIGSVPQLKFKSQAEFEKFETEVNKSIEKISQVAPGVMVTRFGFGGNLIAKQDTLPTSEPRPLTIKEYTESLKGIISHSSTDKTIFNTPASIIKQLNELQLPLESRREALARELVKSWKAYFPTAFKAAKDTTDKAIAEAKEKLSKTKDANQKKELEAELKSLQEQLAGMPEFEKAAQEFSMNEWTLPELEAADYLVKHYGWDEPWFFTSVGPQGERNVQLVTLFDWAIQFEAKNAAQAGLFLAGVQHVASAEGLFLNIFGKDWAKVLKLSKDGKRPSPLEIELRIPLVEKIIKKLNEHQLFASRFYKQDSNGAFSIPKVKWAWEKQQELIKFLDNPEGINEKSEAYKNRIRVPTDEAHVEALLGQSAELMWQQRDVELRGHSTIVSDRLKPMIQTQLEELGKILKPEIDRRDEELRAEFGSKLASMSFEDRHTHRNVINWPNVKGLSEKIAKAMASSGLDYDGLLRTISEMIETTRTSKLPPAELQKQLKEYEDKVLTIVDADIKKDSDFQNLMLIISNAAKYAPGPDRIRLTIKDSQGVAEQILRTIKGKGNIAEINYRSADVRKNLNDERKNQLTIYRSALPEKIERNAQTASLTPAIDNNASIPEQAYIAQQVFQMKNMTAAAIRAGFLDSDVALNKLFGDPDDVATQAVQHWFQDSLLTQERNLGVDKKEDTKLRGYTYSSLMYVGFPVTEGVAKLLHEKDKWGQLKHKILSDALEDNGKSFFESGQKFLKSLENNPSDRLNRTLVRKMMQKMSEDASYREKLLKVPSADYDEVGEKEIAELLFGINEYDFFQQANKNVLVEQLKDMKRFLLASNHIYENAKSLASLYAPKLLESAVTEHPQLLQGEEEEKLKLDVAKDRIKGLITFLGINLGNKEEVDKFSQLIVKSEHFDFGKFLIAARGYLEGRMNENLTAFGNGGQSSARPMGFDDDGKKYQWLLESVPESLRHEKPMDKLLAAIRDVNISARAHVLRTLGKDAEKEDGTISDAVWNRAFGSLEKSLREREFMSLIEKADVSAKEASACQQTLQLALGRSCEKIRSGKTYCGIYGKISTH
jgi:hypothetical protein